MPLIDVRAGKLSFEIAGRHSDGTVLLLHAAGSSPGQWRQVVASLGERFRVVIPSFRGYGESTGWPRGMPPKLEAEADGIVRLLDALGGGIHVVGQGYGASVALRIGLDAPHLLDGITAIEPASFGLLRRGPGNDRTVYLTLAELAVDLARAALNGKADEGVRRFVDFFSGAGTWEQIAIDVRHRMGERIFDIACNVFALAEDRTALDDFAGCAVPVQLVAGDRTMAPVHRVTDRLLSYLPDARQAWLTDAGHMAATSSHAEIVSAMIAEMTAEWAAARTARHDESDNRTDAAA